MKNVVTGFMFGFLAEEKTDPEVCDATPMRREKGDDPQKEKIKFC